MRVAANDVERILQAAKLHSDDTSGEGETRQSMGDIVRAFERAKELNYPLGTRKVKGRKSGVYRTVLATGQENGGHVLCLVPYTQTELDGRRVSRVLPRRVMQKIHKTGPKMGQQQAPWPSEWHHQWIRKDRLEAA
jgi:hypothetical protein